MAELSCGPLKALLVYFRKQHGDPKLRQTLAGLKEPVDLAFLQDEHNWITLRTATAVLDALSEASGDPQFPRKAGRVLATREVLGIAYSLLKAFGGPKLSYRKTFEIGPVYNRIGAFKVLELGNSKIAFTYTSSIPETNRRFCEYRMGQFEAFPTIWGLPLARGRELSCQVEGAPCCSYEFTWIERPLHLGTVAGLAVGGLAGAVSAHLLGLPGPVLTSVLAGAGLTGMLTALWEDRRQIRQRDQLLNEQNQDVLQSMRDLQKRFDELQALNATLDHRVAERTEELHVASAQLEQALARQVELDRAKTRFFTNISHELRTPLTLILAPLEHMLAAGPGAARDEHELEMMHRNGLRLLRNINTLLDLSRLDAQKERLKLGTEDAGKFVGSLIEGMRGLAQERGVELKFHELQKVGPIPFDRDKLEKILLNLISNAIKFTAGQIARPAQVGVTCGVSGDKLQLTVQDNGIGIPFDQLDKIFERFHMVGGAGQKQEGTGIGLSLVKELAELHMGSVTVVSSLNMGSTFTVQLPLRGDAYPAERLDRRLASVPVSLDRRDRTLQERLSSFINDPSLLTLSDLPTQGGPTVQIADPDQPLLLLVDDNRDMLSFLAKLLSKEYRVDTAESAKDAFRLAQTRAPALILSDVNMPERDGYELVSDLRGDQRTRHIPVILLTAKAESRSKIAGLEGGADDYVTKPFDLAELKARIRSLIQQRRLERELAEKNEYLARLNFDLILSRKEVFLETIEALAFSIEAKDPYTHGHSRRVSLLSDSLAEHMGFASSDRERVRIAAVLHDVGKIGIPESILCKPGKLTPEEIEVIKLHPFLGSCILGSVKALAGVTETILHHHERFDGNGYPGKQVQVEIPLASRVLAVADTYDAMTSTRCYRKQLGHDVAVAEIERCSGTQFDPDCVQAFLKLYRTTAPVFPIFPSVFRDLPNLHLLERLRSAAGEV